MQSGNSSKAVKMKLQRKPGLAVVISSPSGTGKTTICRALIDRNRDYEFSVSATSRKRRGLEKNGIDYWFLSREKFLDNKKRGHYIETTNYLGEFYGTPKRPLEKAIENGRVMLLDIDIRGGLSIKKAVPQSVAIFILPPSFAELKKRLKKRETDSPEAQKRRLEEAWNELAKWNHYDYAVVNDNLEKAILEVEMIIEAERKKTCRLDKSKFWPKSLIIPLGLNKKSR
ncbi:MAG: guanylate kinase [candidate division Zixibacteria bacterium]|jgi:guanylate kinase|nr:guanylate kinase [candidate division Zixibacteria bacterium]